jgi:hypothetical protein
VATLANPTVSKLLGFLLDDATCTIANMWVEVTLYERLLLLVLIVKDFDKL